MRAPSHRFLKQTAIVSPPNSGAPGVDGPPIPCSVRRIQDAGNTGRAGGPAPFGMARYDLMFDADPGVSESEQRVTIRGDQDGDYATPLVLLAEGPAEPPQGTSRRWTVSATRRN